MEEAGRDRPSGERRHERMGAPAAIGAFSLLLMTPLADRCLGKLAAVHLVRLSEDRDAFLSLLQRDE